MSAFQADPSNFVDLLQIVRDGHEICLTDGEYSGPFTIERAIAIKGTGANTVIFAADEPALVVKVPGVRLENLAIERTVGGDTGGVVLLASPGTSPVLKQVRLRGVAQNVQWEGASWDIPAVLDFGEIEIHRQVQRSWQLQLGATCEILSDINWLYVQPTYLSPGLQQLDVVINSRDIPAGTILSGSIFLEAADGRREIAIAAKIKASEPTNLGALPDGNANSLQESPEDWGYKFLGNAIDNLIRDFDGKDALDAYTEFTERRNRAEDLIFELVGQQPCLFYLRRKGLGQQPGEEKWELTIATDRNDIKLPAILEERGKTLSLLAAVFPDGNGGLRLLYARLVPRERGQADGFTLPCRIRLLPNDRRYIGVPRTALKRIATMPVCGDRVPTEEQLQAWTGFLNIEERIAKARQFCVPFFNHNYGSVPRRITFEINPTLATIDSTSEEFIKADDFWERAEKARNEDVKLLEIIDESDNGEQKQRLLGCIEEVDSERGFIRVRLESDVVDSMTEGHYYMPNKGFLYFEAAGDLTQIKRKKRALEELQKGSTQNPYLGEFFFDASRARMPPKTVTLQPQDLLLPTANADQIAAVEAVLAAPDMVLIQGPPGTGKTTVIAEICYQVALRGGNTLIASQANLAVDNALSRLIHSPIIRALRKGRADRVGEEGLPFLEEEVIGTWLQNTADDCENGLALRREKVELSRQLLASSERFAGYLKLEKGIELNQKTLRERKTTLEGNLSDIVSKQKQASAQQREIVEFPNQLSALLAEASRVDWEEPAVINLLARLELYTADENLRKNFTTNVNAAANLATRLGWVPPQHTKFGIAAWLHNTVPVQISQAKKELADANNYIATVAKADLAAQALKQNSARLTEMQREYQLLRDRQIPADNLKKQIADVQRQLEPLRLDVKQKQAEASELFQKVTQSLPVLSSSHSAITVQQFSAQVGYCESRMDELERVISSLEHPVAVVEQLKESLSERLSIIQQEASDAQSQLAQLQSQIREISVQLEQQQPGRNVVEARNWWQSAWKAIPDRFKPQVPPTGLFSPEFLRSVKAQFDAWQQELAAEEAYISRYQNFVQDWIEKLRKPSAQDLNELRRIYIDNANVIGITCSQAASYSFVKEFNNFDVVIIDEVSKCTPPELLIPALNGKKLVLIGDYRQLPPMLQENTIEEIAEEMGSTREELGFLEESLFKSQFEAAAESIKRRLTIQYRMHPIIMAAINQFYEHRLQCGIIEPDKQRAHNLAGKIIQDNHHLIWVKMPVEQGFEEQGEGTSFINEREVDVIERLCQQIEAAWDDKVAEGKPRKEIGIITFYGAQLRLIEERLDSKNFPSLHIRTGTVDRFQGMERPVVIVSMVRNNRQGKVGFANKPERVNVAFSRAQELLVVVGCHSLFTQYARGVGSMYSNISDIVRRHGGLIDVSSILS